jgi:hypothetical protein
MRYRSATVAGFHGLPCVPEVERTLTPPTVLTAAAERKFALCHPPLRRESWELVI